MMATVDQGFAQPEQTYELRIEFAADNNVPLKLYTLTLDDLKAILDEVGRNLTHGRVHVQWSLAITPVIQVTASVNGAGPETLEGIVGETFQGLIATQGDQDAEFPNSFGKAAARRAHTLVRRLVSRGEPITLAATAKQTVVIDPEPPKRIERPPRAYVAWSTVDGYLEVLSVHGQPRFVLYEHGSNTAVRCTLPDERMGDLKEWLGNRVRVDGKVHYRRDGSPAAVSEVTDVRVVPQPLHGLLELAGTLPGDISGEDFIGRLRGKNGGNR